MTGDPIWIRCEGSGCPPAARGFVHGMCPMCGQWVELSDHDVVLGHDRDDILARIERGDFG